MSESSYLKHHQNRFPQKPDPLLTHNNLPMLLQDSHLSGLDKDVTDPRPCSLTRALRQVQVNMDFHLCLALSRLDFAAVLPEHTALLF